MKQDILYAKCIDNVVPDYSHIRYNPETLGAYSDSIGEKTLNELEIGKLYEVRYVSMGQSYTNIYLEDIDGGPYNSVLFEFYMNGRKKNIFKDPRYNPYL